MSLSFHLARPTSPRLGLDEMLIIRHDACVIRPEAERALGPLDLAHVSVSLEITHFLILSRDLLTTRLFLDNLRDKG